MIEAIGAVLFTLLSAAAMQSPTHYVPQENPKQVAVFVPSRDSDVYVSDEKPHAPECVEFCNEKGEPE